MIVGYIFLGAIVGILAAGVALLLGTSFWLALGIYAVVGAVTIVLFAAIQMVAGILVDRADTPAHADYWNETRTPRPARSSASQQGADAEASMKILAVDDDPFILELIPMISAKAGFSEVTPAASGEEALKLLVNGKVIFDCFLLDISMAGMDGVELCRQVRQIPRYRHTPIIMLTAMRDMTNMGDAYRAGATDYATKPFDIEELGTRLRLAQETIHAQRETGPARHESAGYNRNSVRNYGFELPDGLPLEGVEGLVDHTVLSNYLTQLPQKEIAGVHVFAVRIDEIEGVHTRSSPRQFAALLKDVAAAAADCFGAKRTVMAYTNSATLLIAVNSANPLSAVNIEIDIERRLQDCIGVSVGGPVQPQGTKTERTRMTTDRVIALADNRALDKQGRPVAGLFKR
ncbi:response regulator [uncultured Marivita sp.]|uniref:response regulator n=1 Tax=uncultured Marivita sp. TaxID=888080 RepID=UPI00262B4ED5|nr:response regulator [uncultured Marivita sp.]